MRWMTHNLKYCSQYTKINVLKFNQQKQSACSVRKNVCIFSCMVNLRSKILTKQLFCGDEVIYETVKQVLKLSCEFVGFFCNKFNINRHTKSQNLTIFTTHSSNISSISYINRTKNQMCAHHRLMHYTFDQTVSFYF